MEKAASIEQTGENQLTITPNPSKTVIEEKIPYYACWDEVPEFFQQHISLCFNQPHGALNKRPIHYHMTIKDVVYCVYNCVSLLSNLQIERQKGPSPSVISEEENFIIKNTYKLSVIIATPQDCVQRIFAYNAKMEIEFFYRVKCTIDHVQYLPIMDPVSTISYYPAYRSAREHYAHPTKFDSSLYCNEELWQEEHGLNLTNADLTNVTVVTE